MKKAYFSAIAISLSVPMGCGSQIEDRLNCRQICNRYADCFDADYDVDSCVENCTDKASDDDDFSRRVDMCETCIDDRSCSEATFSCATECAGIVP